MITNIKSIKHQYTLLYSLIDKEIYLPIFQRGFAWKPVQTEKILEDITNLLETTDKEIYLLDFIWFYENGLFKLADGQQRIVTINILIKCIHQVAQENNIHLTNSIKPFAIHYDDENNDGKYHKFYDNFEEKLVAPYKKVYLKLKEYIFSKKEYLDDIVLIIKNKIRIISKETETVDDAFEIFKQINTGGKPLTKDEIIKTIISQYSKKYNIPIVAELRDIKKMLISYNKLLNPASTSNFDNIAIMSFMNTNVVNTIQNFSKFANYLSAVQLVNKTAIYNVASYIERSQIIDILYILKMKGVDIQNNRHYIDDLLLPLCLLSVVQSIKRVNPGGIIKSFYSEIIEMVKEDKTIQEIVHKIVLFVSENKDISTITLTQFKDGLGGTVLSTNYKKALLVMDVIRSNTTSEIIMSNVNLEHIYPQKPCQKWEEENWPLSSVERSPIINSIGNFLLLNEEINKKIKNKYIDDKKVEYDRIIPCDAALAHTPTNIVDFDRFKNEQQNYVFERQMNIAKLIKANFRLGNVLIVNDPIN